MLHTLSGGNVYRPSKRQCQPCMLTYLTVADVKGAHGVNAAGNTDDNRGDKHQLTW